MLWRSAWLPGFKPGSQQRPIGEVHDEESVGLHASLHAD